MASTTTTSTFVVATSTDEAVMEAYVTSDLKGKAALRTEVKRLMESAMMADDLAGAQRWLALGKGLKAPAKEAVEVDYRQLVADQLATLREAVAIMESGEASLTLPEGVTSDMVSGWAELVGEVNTKLLGELFVVRGRKAGKGAVATYVDEVLGDEPMTIAQLRRAHTKGHSADYPEQPPSQGAIAAMLKRDGGAEFGFEAVEVEDEDGTKRLGAARA